MLIVPRRPRARLRNLVQPARGRPFAPTRFRSREHPASRRSLSRRARLARECRRSELVFAMVIYLLCGLTPEFTGLRGFSRRPVERSIGNLRFASAPVPRLLIELGRRLGQAGPGLPQDCVARSRPSLRDYRRTPPSPVVPTRQAWRWRQCCANEHRSYPPEAR